MKTPRRRLRRDDGWLTLLDLDGNVLGTVDATNVPVTTRDVSIGVGSPPLLGPTVEVTAEVPPGCDTASADGGVRIVAVRRTRPSPPDRAARCRRPVDRVDRPLSGRRPRHRPGSLAVGPTVADPGLTVDGSPIDEWQTVPEAKPLGWTSDGRVIAAHAMSSVVRVPPSPACT